MLLPASGTKFRQQLDQFFQEQDIKPNIRGEFVDSTLVKLFGEAGHGLFCVPASIAFEVQSRYRCKILGSLDGVVTRYFALVPESSVSSPIIGAVLDSARRSLSSKN
jgi:LysR family transcriptional activator of nhaA